MIPEREIKEKAREYGVPVSTIERDYAQSWLLKFLDFSLMTLKGGTGIRKVYIENYRFSDDLDFTLLENADAKFLLNHAKDSVNNVREECGINFNEKIEIIKTVTGFRITIYFTLIRKSSTIPLSIKMDITSPDNEIISLPLKNRNIFHSYSDTLDAEVLVYSLEEIIVEKFRSLFERTRPRDIYDVYYLRDSISRGTVLQILSSKFDHRNVKFDLSSLEERKKDFQTAWKKSLGHQIRELPDFEVVYNDVKNEIGLYETS